MTQQKSERKNNRKTTVIIALLLALIAILSFGGYTLSKYVTSGGSTGKAQVAKWGYTMEIDGSNLFGKNYKFDRVASKVTKDTDGLHDIYDRRSGRSDSVDCDGNRSEKGRHA